MFIIFKVVELKESLGKEKSAYEHNLGSLQIKVDQEQLDLAETRACLQEAELQHANYKVQLRERIYSENFLLYIFSVRFGSVLNLNAYIFGIRKTGFVSII